MSAAAMPSAAGVPAPLRILLVEDSRDVLFLMKMELENLGYSVLTARDAETGLNIAARERPDLIISDIKMPGMDGLELIKRLRAVPELSSTPAIALTGYDTEQDRAQGLAAGYNAHISKPVDPQELAELIRSLTHKEANRS